MSDAADTGAVEAAPIDPQEANEAAEVAAEAPKPKPGWVRHISTDTFHDVEDTNAVFAAYPGQYEDAGKGPGERSKKIGWPADKAAPAE